MGRPHQVVKLASGAVNTRVDIPGIIWNAAEALGKHLGIPERGSLTPAQVGLKLIMTELAQALRNGDTSIFSTAWQPVLADVMQMNGGAGPDLPQIDVTKLHRSAKLKSGYYEVITHAQGFQARAGYGQNLRNIGVYKTPEEAAWARYNYYMRNDMPYGELEEELILAIKAVPTLAGAPLIKVYREAVAHLKAMNYMDAVFGPGTTTVIPKSILEYKEPDIDAMEPISEAEAAMFATGAAHTAKLKAERDGTAGELMGFPNGLPAHLASLDLSKLPPRDGRSGDDD